MGVRRRAREQGTEAGNVTVFHSSDHGVSAAVARFHHHATVRIFATSEYHLFINTNFFLKLLSSSLFFVFFWSHHVALGILIP